MSIKKCSLLLTVLFIPLFSLQAQSINNIQFPSSIKWKQIETEYFILIFPEALEEKADNIAAMIDSYVPADQASLRTQISKWPVIINNSLVYSNAWVLGAPRSSQLYTIPPQGGFIGTDDWLPSIWSHELRHIVQNEKILRGFTKFSKWLAGDYGSSGMSHFAVPQWLWEGRCRTDRDASNFRRPRQTCRIRTRTQNKHP